MLGIYCRISKSKEEGKDTSIETQKQRGIELATELGCEYELYVDEGISGAGENVNDRPEFARMLQDVKGGLLTGVFTLYQDRIERNPSVWQTFVYVMIESECKFYPGGSFFDLNQAENKFFADVMSASNALFASLTAKRVKDSIAKRAEEGRFRGIPAFGYKLDDYGRYEIVESEAEVVREIFEKSRSGKGTYHIANELNQEGRPTRYNTYEGKITKRSKDTDKPTSFNKEDVKWRGGVIYGILRNTVYKGKKKLNDKFYDVPSIISEELWDEVNQALPKKKKDAGRRPKYNYLLNGIIECADCERTFVGKKRLASGDNSYKCKGKVYPSPPCDSSRAININKLDTFIIKLLFKNKSLKKHLLNLPKKSTEYDGLRARFNNEKDNLSKKQAQLNLAYKRLLDPAFEKDEHIKQQVLTLKNAVQSQERLVQNLENDVLLKEHSLRAKRVENLLSSYVDGLDFQEVKKLVHGMIDKIVIKHFKEAGKMGIFHVSIDFKGFDERFTFLTDWKAENWWWLASYRSKALTADELEEDRKDNLARLEYFAKEKIDENKLIEIDAAIIQGIKEDGKTSTEEILAELARSNPFSDSYVGEEVVSQHNELFTVSKDELVYFD